MFWNHKASKEAHEQVARMAELGAFEQAIQSQVPFILFTPAGMVTFSTDRSGNGPLNSTVCSVASRVAASGCEWLEDPPASSLPAWLA